MSDSSFSQDPPGGVLGRDDAVSAGLRRGLRPSLDIDGDEEAVPTATRQGNSRSEDPVEILKAHIDKLKKEIEHEKFTTGAFKLLDHKTATHRNPRMVDDPSGASKKKIATDSLIDSLAQNTYNNEHATKTTLALALEKARLANKERHSTAWNKFASDKVNPSGRTFDKAFKVTLNGPNAHLMGNVVKENEALAAALKKHSVHLGSIQEMQNIGKLVKLQSSDPSYRTESKEIRSPVLDIGGKPVKRDGRQLYNKETVHDFQLIRGTFLYKRRKLYGYNPNFTLEQREKAVTRLEAALQRKLSKGAVTQTAVREHSSAPDLHRLAAAQAVPNVSLMPRPPEGNYWDKQKYDPRRAATSSSLNLKADPFDDSYDEENTSAATSSKTQSLGRKGGKKAFSP